MIPFHQKSLSLITIVSISMVSKRWVTLTPWWTLWEKWSTLLLTWESGWPQLTGVSSYSQGAPPSNQVHGLTVASFERFPRRCHDLQLANQIPPWHEVRWMAWWCCGGDLLTGFGWWLPVRKVSEAGEISFVL